MPRWRILCVATSIWIWLNLTCSSEAKPNANIENCNCDELLLHEEKEHGHYHSHPDKSDMISLVKRDSRLLGGHNLQRKFPELNLIIQKRSAEDILLEDTPSQVPAEVNLASSNSEVGTFTAEQLLRIFIHQGVSVQSSIPGGFDKKIS